MCKPLCWKLQNIAQKTEDLNTWRDTLCAHIKIPNNVKVSIPQNSSIDLKISNQNLSSLFKNRNWQTDLKTFIDYKWPIILKIILKNKNKFGELILIFKTQSKNRVIMQCVISI